jgi:hypothetical protein
MTMLAIFKRKMHVGVLHHNNMRWGKSWVLTSNVVYYELPHVWVTHSFTWTNSHQCTFMYIDTCGKEFIPFYISLYLLLNFHWILYSIEKLLILKSNNYLAFKGDSK